MFKYPFTNNLNFNKIHLHKIQNGARTGTRLAGEGCSWWSRISINFLLSDPLP